MSGNKVGVFLCQGGGGQAESPEFRKLKWWSQAGFPQAEVFEISRACQPKGMNGIAELCAKHDLDTVVLGACSHSRDQAGLNKALRSQDVELKQFRELDVCQSPNGPLEACRVAPQAERSLKLIAAELDQACEPQPEAMLISRRVLIIGAGLAALSAAQDLARAGHAVFLLTPSSRLTLPEPLYGPEGRAKAQRLKEQIEAENAVELLQGAELLSLSGSAGAFDAVVLDTQGERRRLNIGAVLFCQGPAQVLNLDQAAGPSVVALNELLALLAAPEHFKKRFSQNPLRVGIALGLERQAMPAHLAAASRAALTMLDEHGAGVTIFTDYAKVAQPELEALTQSVRGRGGILVKSTVQAPVFSISDQAVTVEYTDEIAEVGISQELDLLAVDTRPGVDESWLRLVERLGLSPNPQGYVSDSRPGLDQGETARMGVYALGDASGPMSLAQLEDQLKQAVGSVERLLPKTDSGAVLNLVKVDRKKCALCLTCVRVCPTGAMGKAARRPQSNPLICTGCGTCASECPMDAIQLCNVEDARMNRVIKAGLESPDAWTASEPGPEVLLLACANSAVRSLRKARAQGMTLPAGVRLVEVPCAGKVDPDMVLKALKEGYDIVQVVSCHPEACYSLEGNTWAGYREAYLRRLLEEAGLDSNRLVWESAAPNMAQAAQELVEAAYAKAEKLGPNPLKAAAKARDILSKFTIKLDDTFTLLP